MVQAYRHTHAHKKSYSSIPARKNLLFYSAHFVHFSKWKWIKLGGKRIVCQNYILIVQCMQYCCILKNRIGVYKWCDWCGWRKKDVCRSRSKLSNISISSVNEVLIENDCYYIIFIIIEILKGFYAENCHLILFRHLSYGVIVNTFFIRQPNNVNTEWGETYKQINEPYYNCRKFRENS